MKLFDEFMEEVLNLNWSMDTCKIRKQKREQPVYDQKNCWRERVKLLGNTCQLVEDLGNVKIANMYITNKPK